MDISEDMPGTRTVESSTAGGPTTFPSSHFGEALTEHTASGYR